jgi:hypothetical protein
LLPEALSGRLDPAEEKRVMAHLETCPACIDAAADIEIALVSLATLRVARDEMVAAPAPMALRTDSTSGTATGTIDLRDPSAPAEPAGPPAGVLRVADAEQPDPSMVIALPARRPVRRGLLAVAAAVVLLAAGAVAGHQLLPPRDTAHYGPALALSPPAGATDAAARGSVKVASEGDALAVRLTATALPAAGWYECVWNSDGQTRSAGSFRASSGSVDVELRVAPPKTPGAWDLQVVAHNGTSSEVVLEGNAAAPS